MRTTVTFDPRLLEKLKKRASETGGSVSQILEQAARLLLQDQPPKERRKKFKLVTFGRGGRFSQKNIDKTSVLLEIEDRERFGQRR